MPVTVIVGVVNTVLVSVTVSVVSVTSWLTSNNIMIMMIIIVIIIIIIIIIVIIMIIIISKKAIVYGKLLNIT